MNDYFIDPLGRGPKGMPPPPPHQQQHALSNSGRGAMGLTILAPIFPDAGFESSHLDSIDNVSILQPQHILASQHRATTMTLQNYPQQQQYHHQQHHHHQPKYPLQVPVADTDRRYFSPNNEIPPSPMQVYMLSSSTNDKYDNRSGATERRNTHIRDEQSYHYNGISPSATHNFHNGQKTRPQHHSHHHEHLTPSSQHHLLEATRYHHPQRLIEIQGDEHDHCNVKRTWHPLEGSRQFHQQQQPQHGYNHPRSTQSDPLPPPTTPSTHFMIDPHCRLVSSDSETIFHRNGHGSSHFNKDSYDTTNRIVSTPSRNPPPSCVGASSHLLCCGGAVTDEDHRFRHEDHRYQHHNHQYRHDNLKCREKSCRHHHHTHPHPDLQEEQRDYDPSMDIRLHGPADGYHRHESREAPPPAPLLPLSPLTIPSVVNSPAVIEYRQYGCPQCSTDATCSEDGLHTGVGLENDYSSHNANFHNMVDAKGRYHHGYPSHPHTTPKIVPQKNCHCYHDHPKDDWYNHKKHPVAHDPTRIAPMREVYPTTKYDDPLLPQQRDDFNRGTSTAYYNPQHHHRHPPPPPLQSPHPGISQHHHCCDHPLRQEQCSHPHEYYRASNLRIEIPHSPPPTTKNRPPVHNNGLNGNGGGGRSRTPTRSASTSGTNHNHRHSSSSSVTFAEYEKRQSEARQQLLREISQATTMRNSALDEEDRKFWERQIDTLNQTFRKL